MAEHPVTSGGTPSDERTTQWATWVRSCGGLGRNNDTWRMVTTGRAPVQSHGLRIFAIDELPAAKRAWVRSSVTSKGRQRVGLCKTCRVGKYPEILDTVHTISE